MMIKILSELLSNISSLSSIYHKPPETFIPKLKHVARKKKEVNKDQSTNNPKLIVLNKEKGLGLSIEASFNRRNNQIYLDFCFNNSSSIHISMFYIKFNKNLYKLNTTINVIDCSVQVGSKNEYSILCDESNEVDPNFKEQIQMAVKCEIGTFAFLVPLNLNIFPSERQTLNNVEINIPTNGGANVQNPPSNPYNEDVLIPL